MHELVQVVGYLNLVAFAAVWLAAFRQWAARRDRAALWAMVAFATLALVVVVGRLLPEETDVTALGVIERVEVVVLLVFPYFLYRFTTAFDPSSRRVEIVLSAMTAAMVVWTFALPSFPETGEPRPAWFLAYLAAFLVHWTVLSVISAGRLWRAGRGQPSVARRRMRLLAGASASLTLAIVVAAASTDPDSSLAAAGGLLAFVSAVAFFLGLAPPALVRLAWRLPEQHRLQRAIESLMTAATSREEIAGRVLAPMADIVGARAVAIRDAEGQVLGTHNIEGSEVELPGVADVRETVLELEVPGGGSLVVWTTRYAPFFGEEELDLLRTLGALTGLALDRVRLFEGEHTARLALERADEVKTNFVALAAHELRAPVTTIHGFVHTLNRRGRELADETRENLMHTLEQQTVRMSVLVEQLLDLSRLDAEAIAIHPTRLLVRERIEEVAGAVLPEPAETVRVDVPADLEVEVDPSALERILANLLTNAARYGEPPIIVRAERTDRHLRLSVEDRGPGVTPEFVPDLFERFARSEGSRGKAGGTGLGLAIARSFARASGGDLLYEPAEPHGACFKLVLPAGSSVR